MTRALIITKRGDAHSLFVQAALMQQGAEAICWVGAEFPQYEKGARRISNNAESLRIEGRDIELAKADIDVVWFRRPTKPALPKDPALREKRYLERECIEFVKAQWKTLGDNAFWINSLDGYTRARSKQLQLNIAVKVGLTIPETLISNDKVRIRNFLDEFKESGVIFKVFSAAAWTKSDDIAIVNTTDVNAGDVQDSLMLEITPGIFQEKIYKAYELRITFFGTYFVAAKILSQEHRDGKTDWRMIPPRELIVEPGTLPTQIADKCRQLMDQLGIVFGCFDFIVTPDGQYYFLEVNEMGQFLWIERACPDLPMLSLFTEFIKHGRKDFDGRCDLSISMSRVLHSSELKRIYRQDYQLSNHIM